MMQQYRRIKNEYADAILFFRLGDFYEMFENDAVEVSGLLDLILTRRNNVPMCGIPYHAAEGYIARLIKAGKKVAICEQTHVPQSGFIRPPGSGGIARREVTEVITPGTVIDENLLEKTANNYLVCLGRFKGFISLSYIDLSTSDFSSTHFPVENSIERLKKELLHLAPREILIQESLLEEDDALKDLLYEREGCIFNRYPDWTFDPETNRLRLQKQFNMANLKGLGLQEDAPEIITAGVILEYITDTAGRILPHLHNLRIYSEQTYVGLDESTQRNLELISNLHDRTKRYSLLEVMDQTRTAMGSRKLKRWILGPLKSVEEIDQRLTRVDFFYRNQILLSKIREQLGRLFDLERLSSRVAMKKAHAKDLLAIRTSFTGILLLTNLLTPYPELEPMIRVVTENLDCIQGLEKLLVDSIMEEPSLLFNEGNLIKPGYNQELDRLRELKRNVRHVLEEYLKNEREKTGIASLKLKYNRILGYFLEATRPNLHLVPPYFIRRQTIVNGERYTTEVLADKEGEINSASEKIIQLEKELFLEIRTKIGDAIRIIQELCRVFSEMDVLQSFAFTATIHGYVRPVIKSTGVLKIEDGRHPVVEANLPAGSFIPNSIHLSKSSGSLVLLTGPNMAGKSTFMRQVALIVLMAQVGSFVPASEARIGIVDSIFCRVGATDNLARGESTFLVEMNETANILRSATPDSLIIMDEVGRGTGTNDGLAIAWAILEFLLDRVKAKTLFATHYHQLTTVKHKKLLNLSMAVMETVEGIIFLKKVRDGPTDNSYGIHAAQLAGIPDEVIQKSKALLEKLNIKDDHAGPLKDIDSNRQPLLFSPLEVLRDELLGLDLTRTTPLEALNRLARWQDGLISEGKS